MTWDLATAKLKTGVTDDDPAHVLWMATTVSIIESYLDRGILRVENDTVTFYDVQERLTMLYRYPVETVNITVPTTVPTYHLLKPQGQLKWHGQTFFEELTLAYTGGYAVDALPPDLEMVMWDTFLSLWNDNYGNDSSSNIPVGEVKKKSIVGVGTIEYTTSADMAGGSSNDLSAIIPKAGLAILDMYMRYSA